MIHRFVFLLLGLLLAVPLGAAEGRRPNIVYLLADDLGIGDLGTYGQTMMATPHLDRLAAGGMRFLNHYAANSSCGPSRSSFLTGRHTGRVRHRDNRRFVHSYGFKPEDVTFAEVMRDAGYATAIAGKWHLGDRADSTDIPHYHGFDYAYCIGFPYPDRGWEHWPSHVFVNGVQTDIPGNGGGRKERYMDDLYTDAALEFIRKNRGKPFLVFLSFQGVHVPMDGKISPRYANRDWPEVEKVFASMLERLDENVGRVLAELQALGLERDTVVFFSSDNGPQRQAGHNPEFFDSNGPWRGYKFEFFEGGIRSPLIVSWPGTIAPGSTNADICTLWDMLPTFAELGGATIPPGVDGISIVPLLQGRKPVRTHEYLYWETQSDTGSQAVRWRDWKGIRTGLAKNADAPFALYDLGKDPTESRDVGAQHPDVVARLKAIAGEAHERSLETPLFESEKDGARIPPEGSFTLNPPGSRR